VRPASAPSARPEQGRLLVIDPRSGARLDRRVEDLPALLSPGDLLVVNDAATLPASLPARAPGGAAVELRLVSWEGGARWWVVLFGEGDWRTPTEHRPAPPALALGEQLRLPDGVEATLEARSPLSDRLVRLGFDREGEALWRSLYRQGRPIQYSYLSEELPLSAVQTAYAARPWAVEMPSAGYALRWSVLAALRAAGVEVAWLTHAAGISATGDDALDALLPLPERYEIPRETAAALQRARARGGRVIAVGTSVVRALEGSARQHGGWPVAGPGRTDLVLRAGSPLAVVDGLLTGMHEAGVSSHYHLLEALAPPAVLADANAAAAQAGYRAHEFGDAALLLPGAVAAGAAEAA
jgi:S-adenosylmethionine:tRNA ribosyltransferase-isomerase